MPVKHLIDALGDIAKSNRSYDSWIAQAVLEKHHDEISDLNSWSYIAAPTDKLQQLCSDLDKWCATAGDRPYSWSIVSSSCIHTVQIQSFFNSPQTAHEQKEPCVSVAVSSNKNRYEAILDCWQEAKGKLRGH